MAFDPQPPGEVGANAHSLIRLRERTVYPQLTDVPSDLRVNGARHASRESLPPSKPGRPHVVRSKTAALSCGRAHRASGRDVSILRPARQNSHRRARRMAAVVGSDRPPPEATAVRRSDPGRRKTRRYTGCARSRLGVMRWRVHIQTTQPIEFARRHTCAIAVRDRP